MDTSQYLGIFLDEAREHIQSLSDQMMILEQEPENQDAISEIFRAAHSLKGMAGTMGYKRLQHLTHVTEDCFSDIRSGSMKVTSELMDVLFQALDAIEGYVNSIQETTDEGEDDNENVVNEINRIRSAETGKGEAKGSVEGRGSAPESLTAEEHERKMGDKLERFFYKNVSPSVLAQVKGDCPRQQFQTVVKQALHLIYDNSEDY